MNLLKSILSGAGFWLVLQVSAQPYSSPKLLFDEDFTDGLFDGFGSGTNGNAWSMAGHARMDTTIRRPFPKAVLRKISAGSGQGWDALLFWDYNGGADVLFDKKDDVVALKFKAFSDAAGNRISPEFGVEVAMLEDKPGAPFGHDMSFEVAQVWLRNGSAEGPLQLDPNVENTPAAFNPGTSRTHHNVAGGKETSATLDSAFMSEVVWRNRFGTGKSNIEVWGKLNSSDFDINAEMASSTPPINPDYLAFNNVQIALFDKCPACTTSANTLLREGTTFSNAQLGIAYCKLGITRVSDFNLDYEINEKDSDTLLAYFGRPSGATLKMGDATNEGRVSLADAAPVTGFWSENTIANASALATYNPGTGEIKLSMQNISYFRIVSPNGRLSGGNPDFSFFNPKITEDSDTVLGGYSDQTWTVQNQSLGLVAAPGLSASEFRIWVNYQGSGLNQGILLDFGQELNTRAEAEPFSPRLIIRLDGMTFPLPDEGPVRMRVVNGLGQELLHREVSRDQPLEFLSPGSGFKTVQFYQPGTRKILLVKKYFSPK